jgi:hypothetical protein
MPFNDSGGKRSGALLTVPRKKRHMDHEFHTYKVQGHDSREAEGRENYFLSKLVVLKINHDDIIIYHLATLKNYANENSDLKTEERGWMGAGRGLDKKLSRTAPPIWTVHGRFSSSILFLLGTAGGMTAVQIRLKTRTECVFSHDKTWSKAFS